MPYSITGDDSTGLPRQAVMQDDGTVTGDGLLTAWLADNPMPAVAGDSPTDAELEQCRQHVSRLLTNPTITLLPPDVPAPEPLAEPPSEQGGF